MLNKDAILGRTSNGLNVFRHYISGQWRVGRNFLNPLYDDKKASCNIYYDRRVQTYRMKDFGNDAFSGDCFDIVGKIKGLDCKNPKDFVEILQTIDRDLGLGLNENEAFVVQKTVTNPEIPQLETPKKLKPYSVVQQSFSAKEIAFWQQYGITLDILKAYKVLSLKEFQSENNEGKPYVIHSKENEPIFGYSGKRYVKIYRPLSEIQLYKNISSILKRGKKEKMPSFFKAYCLTSISRKERMQAIVQSMDKFYYQFGGIQMVVIDGVADLVRCANDEAESVAVIDELYRLAGIYKTCIVCVLHFIPSGLKLRGHLGSELQRKAAAILSIERDEEPQISVVKALKVRDGSPLDVPLIQFSWNKEKAMHTYLGEKPKEEKEKRKETELQAVAKTIFAEKRTYTYSDLCEKIQAILEVKERTAKSYIRFMREKGIIEKDSANDSYFTLKQ